MKIKITDFIKGVSVSLFVLLLLVVLGGKSLTVLAENPSNSTPPSYPSCSSQTPPGDRAHYDYGVHQIVGGGLVEGSDDVYSLSGSNFLQCFCPVEGDNGTQTDWWKFAGLSQEQIDGYINSGWIFEADGTGWNLESGAYLAKNGNYSCGEVTPTPTPTPPSPPGPPGPPPVCVAKDLGGFAPTITEVRRVDSNTVHACWTASTPNANDYIVYYGASRDNLSWNTKVENSQCVDIHQLPEGNVWIKVAATDNCAIGNFSSTVEQTPQVLGAVAPKELPSTGASALILLALAPVGHYLYKRFRLV